MRTRRILRRAVALAVAGYVARIGIITAFEWRRENRMRAMSDEGPLSRELPRLLRETLGEERQFVRELGSLALMFPFEIARYLKVQAM